jgi:hypothetical protein
LKGWEALKKVFFKKPNLIWFLFSVKTAHSVHPQAVIQLKHQLQGHLCENKDLIKKTANSPVFPGCCIVSLRARQQIRIYVITNPGDFFSSSGMRQESLKSRQESQIGMMESWRGSGR